MANAQAPTAPPRDWVILRVNENGAYVAPPLRLPVFHSPYSTVSASRPNITVLIKLAPMPLMARVSTTSKVDGETVSITESGRRLAALLVTAREEILNEFLEGWAPQDHPDVTALVREISARLSGEERGLVGAGRTAAHRSDTGPDVI
jgi:hypothetical protein